MAGSLPGAGEKLLSRRNDNGEIGKGSMTVTKRPVTRYTHQAVSERARRGKAQSQVAVSTPRDERRALHVAAPTAALS
jgi:hypothetical protein